MIKDSGLGVRIGDWDWEMGIRIGISDWDWRLGIGNWD